MPPKLYIETVGCQMNADGKHKDLKRSVKDRLFTKFRLLLVDGKSMLRAK